MAKKKKIAEDEPALFAPPPENDPPPVAEMTTPENDFPEVTSMPYAAPEAEVMAPVVVEVTPEQPVETTPTVEQPAKPKRQRRGKRTQTPTETAPTVEATPTVETSEEEEAGNGERRRRRTKEDAKALPQNNLSEQTQERTKALRELLTAPVATEVESPAAALQRSAMITQISIHGFGNSKRVGKQADRIASDALGIIASNDYRGMLNVIPAETPEWDALLRCKESLLSWWKNPLNTVPWLIEGQYLLPTFKRFEYMEVTAKHQEDFARLVEELADALPRIREEVKARHGEAYRAEWLAFDPAKRFSMVCLPPTEITLPSWIQSLEDPAERAAHQRAWERQIETGGQIAINALLSSFGEVVAKLEERLTPDPLTGEQKKFHSSAIDNVREMFDAMRALNVTNNPALEQLVKRAESCLTGDVDADTVRSLPALQSTIRETCSGLLDTIERDFLVDVPKRARNIQRDTPAQQQPAA